MDKLLRLVESQENYDFIVTRLAAGVVAIAAVMALGLVAAMIAK